MLSYSARRAWITMKNICGNDASHLWCENGRGSRNPTLRIGLISVAPAERNRVWRYLLPFVLISFVSLVACSSRIVYERPTPPIPTDAININIATVVELEKLPHIGPKTAEAIVAFREENGSFHRVEHLMLIKGVSEKRFAELRPSLRTE